MSGPWPRAPPGERELEARHRADMGVLKTECTENNWVSHKSQPRGTNYLDRMSSDVFIDSNFLCLPWSLKLLLFYHHLGEIPEAILYM